MLRDKIINEKLYREVAEELGIEYSQVKDVITCQFTFVKDMIEKRLEKNIILPKIGKIGYNEAIVKKFKELGINKDKDNG